MADPQTVRTAGEDGDLADVERRRLRALVAADLVAADDLHANDFQLITPRGNSVSKDEYVGAIASGNMNYLLWKPEEMDVRVHLGAGCLRYRSTIKIASPVRRAGQHGSGTPISTRNRTDDGGSFGRSATQTSS